MRSLPTFSAIAAAAILLALVVPASVAAQQEHESGPASALAGALTAACRGDAKQFSNYLTVDNAAAFRALPEVQRAAFLKRFSLADEPGRPLLSSDLQNHTILRCMAQEGTTEFRFGNARTRESLAFIPVTVVDAQETEFGLVREGGEWRLLSLGLMLLDVPQLSKQWAAGELAAREESAIATLRSLAEAIQTYRRAYGKLPESLAQLGPAPKNQISPELASLVNEHLAAGSEGGYKFRYRIVPAAQGDDVAFELAAMPDDYGKTGRRSFLLDAAGKVHAADDHGAMATSEDPLVPSAP
jgi:type II secretory pathway pseudopilin PulG